MADFYLAFGQLGPESEWIVLPSSPVAPISIQIIDIARPQKLALLFNSPMRGYPLVYSTAFLMALWRASPVQAETLYKSSYFFEYTRFDETFNPWLLHRLELSRRYPVASIIARLNNGRRFDRWGNQWELDAYPKLKKGLYSYVSAGYSQSTLFPATRYGAELFQSLPKSFEGSLGLRYLDFSSKQVTVYTASLAKSRGNYLITYRVFYTPKDVGASRSGNLQVRRYFATANDYLTLTLGEGTSPDQNVSNLEIFTLESLKGGLGFNRRFGGKWQGKIEFFLEQQELPKGDSRVKSDFGLGLAHEF